jgi:aminoglycoside 6'-N-acetyltransferase I
MQERGLQRAVTIRQATGTEFEFALPLVERFFAEEGFQAPPGQIAVQLAALLDDEESAVFLAWRDDRAGEPNVVGVATVTTTSGIELGLSAELEDLYVLPEARGLGAGAALIEAVKGWCRSRGCSLVSVVVTPEGQAAHDLFSYYRARGFEETGRTLMFAYLQPQAS